MTNLRSVDNLCGINPDDFVNKEIVSLRINKVLCALISSWRNNGSLSGDCMFRSDGALIRTALEYFFKRLGYFDSMDMLDVFLDDVRLELGYKRFKK